MTEKAMLIFYNLDCMAILVEGVLAAIVAFLYIITSVKIYKAGCVNGEILALIIGIWSGLQAFQLGFKLLNMDYSMIETLFKVSPVYGIHFLVTHAINIILYGTLIWWMLLRKYKK